MKKRLYLIILLSLVISAPVSKAQVASSLLEVSVSTDKKLVNKKDEFYLITLEINNISNSTIEDMILATDFVTGKKEKETVKVYSIPGEKRCQFNFIHFTSATFVTSWFGSAVLYDSKGNRLALKPGESSICRLGLSIIKNDSLEFTHNFRLYAKPSASPDDHTLTTIPLVVKSTASIKPMKVPFLSLWSMLILSLTLIFASTLNLRKVFD